MPLTPLTAALKKSLAAKVKARMAQLSPKGNFLDKLIHKIPENATEAEQENTERAPILTRKPSLKKNLFVITPIPTSQKS
jgi:hypothetical protein